MDVAHPGHRASFAANGDAIVSVVFGIISIPLFFGLIPGVVAVVFGTLGLRAASRGAPYHGLAMWGFWLGISSFVLVLVLLVALALSLGAG